MDKKMINETNKIIELEMMKDTAKEMAGYVPIIAKIAMDMYKGLLAEGFNEQQAFSFATQYTLNTIFKQ